MQDGYLPLDERSVAKSLALAMKELSLLDEAKIDEIFGADVFLAENRSNERAREVRFDASTGHFSIIYERGESGRFHEREFSVAYNDLRKNTTAGDILKQTFGNISTDGVKGIVGGRDTQYFAGTVRAIYSAIANDVVNGLYDAGEFNSLYDHTDNRYEFAKNSGRNEAAKSGLHTILEIERRVEDDPNFFRDNFDVDRDGQATPNFTPSRGDVIAGRRNSRAPRTTNPISRLNDENILEGTLYSDISRIPRGTWSKLVRFWDKKPTYGVSKRGTANPFRLLNPLRQWKIIFVLGYQLSTNETYEIWFNTADGMYIVMDYRGSEIAQRTPTLNEAAVNLFRMVAKIQPDDAQHFANSPTDRALMQSFKQTFRSEDKRMAEFVSKYRDAERAGDAHEVTPQHGRSVVQNVVGAAVATHKGYKTAKKFAKDASAFLGGEMYKEVNGYAIERAKRLGPTLPSSHVRGIVTEVDRWVKSLRDNPNYVRSDVADHYRDKVDEIVNRTIRDFDQEVDVVVKDVAGRRGIELPRQVIRVVAGEVKQKAYELGHMPSIDQVAQIVNDSLASSDEVRVGNVGPMSREELDGSKARSPMEVFASNALVRRSNLYKFRNRGRNAEKWQQAISDFSDWASTQQYGYNRDQINAEIENILNRYDVKEDIRTEAGELWDKHEGVRASPISDPQYKVFYGIGRERFVSWAVDNNGYTSETAHREITKILAGAGESIINRENRIKNAGNVWDNSSEVRKSSIYRSRNTHRRLYREAKDEYAKWVSKNNRAYSDEESDEAIRSILMDFDARVEKLIGNTLKESGELKENRSEALVKAAISSMGSHDYDAEYDQIKITPQDINDHRRTVRSVSQQGSNIRDQRARGTMKTLADGIEDRLYIYRDGTRFSKFDIYIAPLINIGRNRKRRLVTPGDPRARWQRVAHFLLGTRYIADFIEGYTIDNRINYEIWYITEPNPTYGKSDQRRTISSYYVFDATSKTLVRKLLPYKRNAEQVIMQKITIYDDPRGS